MLANKALPLCKPFTGMARSHTKASALHRLVGAGHAREQSHTAVQPLSRAWPVPTDSKLLHLPVNHRSFILEPLGLFGEPRLDGFLLVGQAVFGGVFAHFLGDLH